MTHDSLFHNIANQPIPHPEIKKGDTTSFMVDGKMVPFQIERLGFDTITIVSLDLTMKTEIQKSYWARQVELLAECTAQSNTQPT